MFKFIWNILKDERGSTLAVTYSFSANTLIVASQMNTNFSDVEAVVNALTSTNFAKDSVGKAALASDVVRADYGLLQHTDGSLYVKVYGMINRTSDGLTFGRTGDVILSSNVNTPDGWNDVSSTYGDKFIRISATALSTGGSDTHTTPSHTLTIAQIPSHQHTYTFRNTTTHVSESGTGWIGTSEAGSGFTGGGGGHVHGAADNVPVYITLRMIQKA